MSHRSELVYKLTSCSWRCRSTSFMNIPRIPRVGKMLEVQSFVSDPRVHCIGGLMCRWSLKARGSNDKVEFMRKQTRWLTSSKEIAEVPRGDGRWKRDRRHVHMTGKSETASEYLASLVVAMFSAIKRQMISDGAIRVGLQVRCRMKVFAPLSSKGHGESTAHGLTRSS